MCLLQPYLVGELLDFAFILADPFDGLSPCPLLVVQLSLQLSNLQPEEVKVNANLSNQWSMGNRFTRQSEGRVPGPLMPASFSLLICQPLLLLFDFL